MKRNVNNKGITLPRDWSMYVNTSIGATKAEALTKARLDSWYTKYITNGTAANIYTDDTFRQIYGTKYESLIDNYSFYWLSSVYGGNYVCSVHPDMSYVIGYRGCAIGVRILVSLPSSIKLQGTSVETKEVTSRGNKTNYSVWNFAQ